MKISKLASMFCCIALAIISMTVNASLVVPSEFSPGDAYHVVFVSSTTRDATSSSIEDYDAHVQAAADAAGIGVDIGQSWLAIGSTASVNAIDHVASAFPDFDVPIYNQNGDLVSRNFNELWPPGWGSPPINLHSPIGYDENGAISDATPWTGSGPDGTGADAERGSELGGAGPNAVIGSASLSNVGWLTFTERDKFELYSLYGISGQIIVPVPLIPAVWLFASGLLGLIGLSLRRNTA